LQTGVVNLPELRQNRRMGWAGTTLAARRAERRARLLDAALDLLGSQGSAAVSVRSVCRAARLTDRYFYENFADRDALVVAVYDEVARAAGDVLINAVADAGTDEYEPVARAAVDALLDHFAEDPRRGRVLLQEPLGDAALAARGVALSPAFAGIIRAQLAAARDVDAQLAATAIVGAMANLLIRWMDGSLAIDRAGLADFCVRLLTASMALAAPQIASAAPTRDRRPRAAHRSTAPRRVR
jgi:AcrR family transcriptional regulator